MSRPPTDRPADRPALRRARPSDVPLLAALERELFGDDAWSEEAVAAELVAGAGPVVVAAGDGRLLGYVTTRAAGDTADLLRVAVAPGHRRAGLGRLLMARAYDDALTAGATQVLLEVSSTNHAALAFYAAEGFTTLDRRRRYYRDGSDAVVMRRPVTGA